MLDLNPISASLGASKAFHSSSIFLFSVTDSQKLINTYETLIYMAGFTSTIFMMDLPNGLHKNCALLSLSKRLFKKWLVKCHRFSNISIPWFSSGVLLLMFCAAPGGISLSCWVEHHLGGAQVAKADAKSFVADSGCSTPAKPFCHPNWEIRNFFSYVVM